MKKRSPVARSRSSYFIQPKLNPGKTEPLSSPFPPHVHRYLFSGRVIRLCDRSGASIERVVDIGRVAKKQFEAILGKLERKVPVDKLQTKRKSLATAPADPEQPYHLTEAICNTLKKYAEKVRKVEEKKDESSDSSSEILEFQTPPKPSERLIHFLQKLYESDSKNQPKHRITRCLSTGAFTLPRRGSHPGIRMPSPTASSPNSPTTSIRLPTLITTRGSPEPGLRIPFKRRKGLRSRSKGISMFS